MSVKNLYFKGLAVGYINQILIAVFGLISFPLLLNHFGTTQYGLWALIMSFSIYFNTFSFGIPSAMSTWVAKASDELEKIKLLKKSLFLLFAIASIVLILFFASYIYNKNWLISILGNIPKQYIVIAEQVFMIVFVFTLVKLPLSLYTQFFTGMNLVYITNLYSLATTVTNFCAVLFATRFNFDLFYFSLLVMCTQTMVAVISAMHVHIKYSNIKTKETKIDNAAFLKSGLAFMQVGFITLIVTGTDNVVISHILSVDSVTVYSVAFKLFGFILTFLAMLNNVLIPFYGHSFAQKNWVKIEHASNFMLNIVVFLTGILWLGFMFFAKEIIILITHKPEVFGGYLLFFAFGFYAYVLAFVSTYASILQGLDYVKNIIGVSWLQAFLNLLLSIILVKYIGIAGAALGTGLAAFFTEFLMFPKYIRRLAKDKMRYRYNYVIKQGVFVLAPGLLLALYSTQIQSFLYKVILFLFCGVFYLLASWHLLAQGDKDFIRSLLLMKKNVKF